MVEQEKTFNLPEMVKDPLNAKRKSPSWAQVPRGFPARTSWRGWISADRLRGGRGAGGMLVQAIPAYRLPRDILRREIGMIEKLGVQIKTNKVLGRDFTLSSMKEMGYEAVFVAVGAPKGSGLGLSGDDAPGVTRQ